MITLATQRTLQYVKNTNGGATKEIFLEDHAPIGLLLWDILKHEQLVSIDNHGKLWLTAKGTALLQGD